MIFKYLQESLPLSPSELYEDVDKLEESRALLGVAQLGLCVLQDLLTCEHGVLVSTKQCPHLRIDISRIWSLLKSLWGHSMVTNNNSMVTIAKKLESTMM